MIRSEEKEVRAMARARKSSGPKFRSLDSWPHNFSTAQKVMPVVVA